MISKQRSSFAIPVGRPARGAPLIGGLASAPEPATLRLRADLSQLAGAGDGMGSPNKYG